MSAPANFMMPLVSGPDKGKTERQDGEDGVERDLQKLEQIERQRQDEHQRHAEQPDGGQAPVGPQHCDHRLPRK
jgi:hypothetical protein